MLLRPVSDGWIILLFLMCVFGTIIAVLDGVMGFGHQYFEFVALVAGSLGIPLFGSEAEARGLLPAK